MKPVPRTATCCKLNRQGKPCRGHDLGWCDGKLYCKFHHPHSVENYQIRQLTRPQQAPDPELPRLPICKPFSPQVQAWVNRMARASLAAYREDEAEEERILAEERKNRPPNPEVLRRQKLREV